VVEASRSGGGVHREYFRCKLDSRRWDRLRISLPPAAMTKEEKTRRNYIICGLYLELSPPRGECETITCVTKPVSSTVNISNFSLQFIQRALIHPPLQPALIRNYLLEFQDSYFKFGYIREDISICQSNSTAYISQSPTSPPSCPNSESSCRI
jgi:hypothetical protein